MGSSTASSAAIKAAKKSLKKQDSGSMKLKVLAKTVAENIGNDSKPNVDNIKKWIEASSKFTVEGKVVMLTTRKRKLDEGKDGNANGRSSGDEKRKKKEAKKARKRAKKEAISSKAENGYRDGSLLDAPAVSKWRQEHKIMLKDTHDGKEGAAATELINSNAAYHPYTTFESPGCKSEIAEQLLRQCTDVNGFMKPSPIQAQCWPVLLHSGDDGKRRDVVGIAETGSGKTLAFALPALTAMHKADCAVNTSGSGKSKLRAPRMLILAPTRELAMQSHEVMKEFGSVVNLRSIVVYGGVPKHAQTSELRRGVDCVVATPGRLKDLVNEQSCDLRQVHHLVLDEADRMLDMGFEEDVRYIISKCPDKCDGRQTAMFSATWPAAIQKIALDYMVNPVRVYVGFEAIVGSNGDNSVDDSLSANKRVTQTVEVIEDRARNSRLRELLNKYHRKNKSDRILIFALYKKEAQRLENSLRRDGWDCCSIHGDKTQDARTKALAEFKSGKCPLLVATDVAARGLDIPNVEVVLNFTFPLTIEDYVHRIGRTGRAGKTGISHTFFQPGDKSHAGELQQVMKQAGQPVPDALMKFGSTIKKKEHKLYGNFGPSGNGKPMKKAIKITFEHSDED